MEIWIQLGWAAAMVILCTLAHGLGLVGVSRLFRLEDKEIERHPFDIKAVVLMVAIALSLFTLHAVEIAAYASFYVAAGAIENIEAALIYSASAYATLGYMGANFPEDWQLLAATEALVGFLLIGWSTAFLVHNINRMQKKR